ncbi:uncharacterized protein [Ptychodera flava]|uniref:uncharacterized protein n=1 Tax=Ptychodera flava TaxID=63121 RepID=UPI00396A8A51
MSSSRFVCVTDNIKTGESIELPTEENLTVLLSTLEGQFPGACGLRYKPKTFRPGPNRSESERFRGVRMEGRVLYPPHCGWDNVELYVVYSDCKTKDVEEHKKGFFGKVKSFKSYKDEKSSVFRKLPFTASKKKSKSQDEQVTINIGLMYFDEKTGVLKPHWGKRLPIKVHRNANYSAILESGLSKWKVFRKKFIDDGMNYFLLFEDGSRAIFIPGEEKKEFFTLCKYKEALGREYKRICLYLCPEDDFDKAEGFESFIDHEDNEVLCDYDDDNGMDDHEIKSVDRSTGSLKTSDIDNNPPNKRRRIKFGDPTDSNTGHRVVCHNSRSVQSDTNSMDSQTEFKRDDVTQTVSDSVYATLFTDDLDNHCSDSEDDVKVVSPELPAEIPFQDILSNLATQINKDKISKFNISRNKLLEGVKRGLKRKSFNPCNKISVKFTDDEGSSEGAVDAGGPMREMLTLSLNHITNSQLFDGDADSKYISCVAKCIDENEYYFAGQLIAMSLVHGFPPTLFC